MDLRPLLLAGLFLASAFSGCLGGTDAPEPEAESEGDEWRAFSVVAPIDTGINIYHDHFRTNETYPDWMLEMFNVTKVFEPTFDGDYQQRLDADADFWSNVTASDIVYFVGTCIIGTSPDWTDGDGIPILDDPQDGHGTAVTGSVINANPDAVIFFVEGFSDTAVLAAANQPLVDIITTSFGPVGSIPVPGIEDATKVAVVENGKIHTGAADNSPSPAVQDSTAGPPWSIGISGYAEEDDDQKEPMSGSYPDIAGDWTQNLPTHDSVDGYDDTSGTSFATPRTAGILSAVLQSLRDEYNDPLAGAYESSALVHGTDPGNEINLTQADIRDALNLSAWYPSFTTWDPLTGSAPISPVAPCTQVGWGVVNMSNVEPIIQHLNGTEQMSQRPADVVACMDLNQQARYTYWGE